MAKKDGYIDQIIRLALIALIVMWSIQLLYPLSGILAWGFILAVIVYPMYEWLTGRIGMRPIVSATAITICLLLLVLGITFFITNDIVQSLRHITSRIHANEQVIPIPPATIKDWPLIGNQLHDAWASASQNLESEISKYSEPLVQTGKYAFSKLITTSKNLLLFVISIILSGFLLIYSDRFMVFIRKLAKRIADENGLAMLSIIKSTIQSVSRGIIGIALLQTIIFWLLLTIAEVPGVGLLSVLALILSIAQIGLFILIIPTIIWLFFTKTLSLTIIISILLILDAFIDSFLKPIVLARGLSTPMIIIFIGVIGGIIVYGLIGVFIGPVVLAIAYNLMTHWIQAET